MRFSQWRSATIKLPEQNKAWNLVLDFPDSRTTLLSFLEEGVWMHDINDIDARSLLKEIQQTQLFIKDKTLNTFPSLRLSDPLTSQGCPSFAKHNQDLRQQLFLGRQAPLHCHPSLARHNQELWQHQADSRLTPLSMVGLNFLHCSFIIYSSYGIVLWKHKQVITFSHTNKFTSLMYIYALQFK